MSTGTSSGSEGSGGDDTGVKFDTPSGNSTAGDGPGQEGCQKVDFLFVIDSSGSMGDDQERLVDSFPQFISTIASTLGGQDYHIMVVDTDGKDVCDEICEDGASFCAIGPGCDTILTGCDVELGAGRVLDENKNPCPVDGTDRYLTEEQTDLSGTFGCVAKVGTAGQGDEQPIGAMLAALSDVQNGINGCNEGFLRDDAILVVTLVADAPPMTSSELAGGDPAAWHAEVVALKNGNESAISMLGLVSDGDIGGDCAGNMDDSKWGSPPLRQFVQLFERNVLGSVCAPSYAPFFETAVDIVDAACDDFVPEG